MFSHIFFVNYFFRLTIFESFKDSKYYFNASFIKNYTSNRKKCDNIPHNKYIMGLFPVVLN